jgi:hypothetical protein
MATGKRRNINNPKGRYNISIDARTVRAGRAIARAERRSFSNLIEVLVQRAAAAAKTSKGVA